MNKLDNALSFFKDGFNCSQAVLTAFSKSFGMDRETALRVAQAFGSGMARMAETCGAVTGAFMVIGLKHGRISVEDESAKEITYEKVQEFVKEFKAIHGSLRCGELLGYNISDPEQLKRVEEEQLFETRCPNFVQDSVRILEEIL